MIENENGNCYIGLHDIKLDLKTLAFKSLYAPFGVVILSKKPEFEEVIEDNGDVVTI